ncbi:helix-turn-helix domain-containing protein [Nesterenkonia muleiensis]|uniref:helix-turn-helix domain-containing protein n=1 Tax=Nesterenkonia muleiensis TaxID=2282648 RepID=UPI003B75BA66
MSANASQGDNMRKFLTLPDVAEALNISMSQTRALINRGELEGIQIGGRGQWRVEQEKLDEYIDRLYAEQRQARADRTEVSG